MRNAELECQCGKVAGSVSQASPENATRIVCYCDDCQAFAHYLRREDLLDAHGGSDIVQVAPASLSFHRGREHIACLRLSPKGLKRFYTTCCRTPVGNTVAPAVPFVGIVVKTFSNSKQGQAADAYFGAPLGIIQQKYALGTPENHGVGTLGLILRSLRKMVTWRLRGQTWPHPFFARSTGEIAFPVQVLSKAERDALRPLCGPRPAAPDTHASGPVRP